MLLRRYLPSWSRRALRRLRASPKAPAVPVPGHQPVQPSGSQSEAETLVVRMYQLALDRTPGPEERQIWTGQILDGRLSAASFVEVIATSPEAEAVRAQSAILPELPNGKFVQFAYEQLLGRGAMADEIVHWDHRIARQNLRRDRLVNSLFSHRAKEALTPPSQLEPSHASLAQVMGTETMIDTAEWQERADAIGPDAPRIVPKTFSSLSFQPRPEILVSAIASLYKGGDYIEQFLENITSQSIFAHCELIIINADSPEDEFSTISRYMERFPNIVYHRTPTRIGIYEAWNLGVEMARGLYITNTNLDDLRRWDSFERQVEILEKFPFVDVVYQDFYYSFDGAASFDRTAAVGVQSKLPIVTPYNLMRSNSPHNAPMWRRTVHDDVGLFDASYRSAGDYDFWLRCIQAGKVFYKVNDPHVVYFVNPEGLSTRPNTRGIEEANRATREHARQIISSRLTSSDEAFLADMSQFIDAPIDLSETERASPEWRYAAIQRALRLRSIASRRTATVKE
jgi:GT2 family glycosyltransferase